MVKIFYQYFRVVLLQIHLGSGAARIRIRNDFFRIRIRIMLKVSALTRSGSTTLFRSFRLTFRKHCNGLKTLFCSTNGLTSGSV